MSARDPRVDAYVARSADFARPVVEHLRALVHATCPQAEETLKWGMPTFLYHGILCGIGAFKHHCTFGFWKHRLVVGAARNDEAMGQFGCITKISDLPPKRELAALIRKAMALNEAGINETRRRAPRPPPKTPADLAAALKRNKRALATYDAFSPSARRDYVDWITEAKTEATRLKRLTTAVEWMADGKQRNWKYMNC